MLVEQREATVTNVSADAGGCERSLGLIKMWDYGSFSRLKQKASGSMNILW